MKSGDALRDFTRLLTARGTRAEVISVRDGIEAMLDFYRSTRADDCSFESDGDTLMFQSVVLTSAASVFVGGS